MTGLTLQGFHTVNLRHVDLEVAAGECVALWGPSGSGKSRLLRAIADLDPHQGEALCGTDRRSAMKAPEWRRRVGLLLAESHWWSERVGDHFPTEAGIDLQRIGLPEDALEWEVERISSGEKQRLALLRMLAVQPEVLLLDEATANLDRDNIARVETLIAEYREQHRTAVLWVSHDAEQRRRVADRSLQIIGDGLKEASEWT